MDPASAVLAACFAEVAGFGTAAGDGTLSASFLAAAPGSEGGEGSFSAVCFTAAAAPLGAAEDVVWEDSATNVQPMGVTSA